MDILALAPKAPLALRTLADQMLYRTARMSFHRPARLAALLAN